MSSEKANQVKPSQPPTSTLISEDVALCFAAACQSCISGYHTLEVALAVLRHKLRPRGIPDVTSWV